MGQAKNFLLNLLKRSSRKCFGHTHTMKYMSMNFLPDHNVFIHLQSSIIAFSARKIGYMLILTTIAKYIPAIPQPNAKTFRQSADTIVKTTASVM